MSRTIDLSKRLSEDDREYLLARGREQEVFQNDAEHTDDPEAARFASYIPGTSVDEAPGVPPTEGGDPLVNNGGGVSQGTPKFGTPANQAEAGEAGDAGVGALRVEVEESEEGSETYTGEQWDKAALVAEIERRNAEYGEEYQLPTSGTKKELAARLVEDDNTPEDDEDDESA